MSLFPLVLWAFVVWAFVVWAFVVEPAYRARAPLDPQKWVLWPLKPCV